MTRRFVIDTSALPSVISQAISLATTIASILRAEPERASVIAELAQLPADWRDRAAKLASRGIGDVAVWTALATSTAAMRRGIGNAIADSARRIGDRGTAAVVSTAAAAPVVPLSTDELELAIVEPLVAFIVRALAWQSPAVAAAYGELMARAEAYARAAVGVGDDADVKRALELVLAIPASEPAMRAAMKTPIAGVRASAQPSPRRDVTATPAPARTIEQAIDAAFGVLRDTQAPQGSWHGDYGGPLFLLPMYVGTAHALGVALDAATRDGMIAYLTAHQNPDGGWGLDVEGDSHVFTSVLNYVALRLLGVAADDPRTANARAWFLPRGGALASASWGKFFLAVLGLYDYAGVAPVPPELWILPEAAPVHPSRMWCHARMVYLPMSYLYGKRAAVTGDATLRALRDELYAEPYAQIDWPAARDRVAASDLYKPHTTSLTAAHAALGAYERFSIRAVRARALAKIVDHIDFEDRATNYLCIGPVNKLFNALVWHFERPGGAEVRAHVEKLPAYLWRADDGVKMQGYNSSELWDTAFAIQAIAAANRGAAARPTLVRASAYLERNQIIAEPPNSFAYYRNASVGGWPFSTRAHGWPITDCTAEGLKAAHALDALRLADDITPARRHDSIELILGWQNDDGGWASYERTRGPKWLEQLNPSEVFGAIMIDTSFTECTSACVQALRTELPKLPPAEQPRVIAAIERGEACLLKQQRADGSWEGAWGVCFTYGTWFAVGALAGSADRRALDAVERACAFLRAHQQPDGGWGETVEACRRRHYIHAETGQAVMTSWALLALIRAGHADSPAVRDGVRFLLRRQQADGRWPAEHIAGVFNHTCAIHYDAYLRVFPLWALAAARAAAT